MLSGAPKWQNPVLRHFGAWYSYRVALPWLFAVMVGLFVMVDLGGSLRYPPFVVVFPAFVFVKRPLETSSLMIY